MISQAGLGKGRDPWAIRKFLDEKGLNMAAVGRAIGSPRSKVHSTVRGTENHRATLAYLLRIGVPARDLFPLAAQDPETHARAFLALAKTLIREHHVPASALTLTGMARARLAA